MEKETLKFLSVWALASLMVATLPYLYMSGRVIAGHSVLAMALLMFVAAGAERRQVRFSTAA